MEMKKYIQPETKHVMVNAESLMDEEMQIVSDPSQAVTNPDDILGNESNTWDEEIPQAKSVWE